MMKEIEREKIKELLETYTGRPEAFRVFVMYCSDPLRKAEVATYVARELKGKYVNFLDDKAAEISLPVGQYSPEDLKDDIESWSDDVKTVAVVDDLEPVFDSWQRSKLRDFFRMIARIRTESVVLIPTYFDLDYESLLGIGRSFGVK